MVKVYYSVKKIVHDLPFDENLFPQAVVEHIKRYKDEGAYEQSAQAWTLLAKVIEKSFGKDIKKLKINFSKRGKPYCRKFNFSISHIDGFVAVSVSKKPCGIDIEKIVQRKNMGQISKVVLGGTALDEMGLFYENWTTAEAVSKMFDIPVCDVKDLKENSYQKTHIKKKEYVVCIVSTKKFDIVKIS